MIKLTKLIVIVLLAMTLGGNAFSQITKLDKIPETATQVVTGIYIMNVYNMDMEANSYYCDFYIWFRWKGDIDPIAELEFVNYVDKWGYMSTPLYDKVKVLKDGSKYMMLRVESRFYQPFSLAAYPLDKQVLDIQVENSEHGIDELVYVADTEQSRLRSELEIPGWDILGMTITDNANLYTSNFGDLDDDDAVPYSNLSFKINIKRPTTYFLFKLMFPLLLVIMGSLGAMMLFAGHVDARVSLPIGSLLTAVFLQQSYTSSLPEIGYMVLMDKIYLLSYFVIIASLLEAIITANWVAKEGEENCVRIRKQDIKVMSALFLLFIIGVVIIVLTST